MPWALLCDGKWDCPGGIDEAACQERNCAGQFKCKDSSICIWPERHCDSNNIIDCPLGDDESFCDLVSLRCPDDCSCLMYSLFCNTSLAGFDKTNNLAYISLNIINIKISSVYPRLSKFDQPIFVKLSCAPPTKLLLCAILVHTTGNRIVQWGMMNINVSTERAMACSNRSGSLLEILIYVPHGGHFLRVQVFM